MPRKIHQIAAYSAVSYRLSRDGEVALYHIRMDGLPHRLITEELDRYMWDGERPPSGPRQLELAVRLLLRRQDAEQLPLW